LNISVNVTVLKDCSNCVTKSYACWQPNFTGKPIDGANIGGDLGILAGSSSLRANISGNTLRIGSDGTDRPMRIITSAGADGAAAAGWNKNTSFYARPGVTYEASFTASVSSGTGSIRISTRVPGEDRMESVNVDLTTTAKTVTYK
jgi:hypothetical protein